VSAREPSKRGSRKTGKGAVHADQTTPHVPAVNVAATTADEPDPATRNGDGRKTRKRYGGGLPKPNATAELPYAQSRPELAGLTEAQTVRAMLDSAAWRDTMQPTLDTMQAKRVARQKVAPAYSCEELEAVFLYQMACDIDTVRETLDRLTSTRGAEARRLLGFDRPRQSKGQVTPLHAVPSAATLSRYKLSWAPDDAGRVAQATRGSVAAGNAPGIYDFKAADEVRQRAAAAARRDAYRRFLYRWVEENFKDPVFREQADLMFMDGTSLHTIFSCLVRKPDGETEENNQPRARKRCRVKPVLDQNNRVVWDGQLSEEQWEALEEQRDLAYKRYWKVTADGGYMAYRAGRNRGGHGYTAVTLTDQGGLPLDFVMSPINQSERIHAMRLLDSFGDNVKPLLDPNGKPDKPRVLSADAGFTGHRIRNRIRDLGAVENIHQVSGSKRKRSTDWDKKLSEKKQAIVHPKTRTKNWYADGHRDIHCVCGQGQTSSKFYTRQDGRVVPRVIGECGNCGSISITSGQWRLKGGEWKRVDPSNEHDVPDLMMGNPLTFHSDLSGEYARRRFSVNEGFYSVLSNRFGVIRGRRRVKRIEEAELQVAMASCLLHAIAHEGRRRAQAANAQTPPGQAAPGQVAANAPPGQAAAA
jgi:hypothetical protein